MPTITIRLSDEQTALLRSRHGDVSEWLGLVASRIAAREVTAIERDMVQSAKLKIGKDMEFTKRVVEIIRATNDDRLQPLAIPQ